MQKCFIIFSCLVRFFVRKRFFVLKNQSFFKNNKRFFLRFLIKRNFFRPPEIRRPMCSPRAIRQLRPFCLSDEQLRVVAHFEHLASPSSGSPTWHLAKSPAPRQADRPLLGKSSGFLHQKNRFFKRFPKSIFF